MNRVSKGEKIFQESVGTLILLSGLFVGVGAAQQKPPKTPPAPPKAVAPHVNAPAHSTMSKQVLESERVREGLKDVLLGPAGLYEALRERAGEHSEA